MKIKICGLKEQTHVEVAVQAGADYLGFIFVPSSPRYISPEKVADITKNVPKSIKKVGVFVNPTIVEIERIQKIASLDLIQLHGVESKQLIKNISQPVIKAIPADNFLIKEAIAAYPNDTVLLLDTPSSSGVDFGGKGETFDWDKVEWSLLTGRKFFIAGGLTNENVARAIKQLHPYGVDVSSGVETSKRKDSKKIRTFIQIVRKEENDE